MTTRQFSDCEPSVLATDKLRDDRNVRYSDSVGSPDKPQDDRRPSQRDADRVMYSTAFRRLGAITQVATEDGHLFHNRLTHSMKTAQLGRRIAEKLIAEVMALPPDQMEVLLDVVERLGGLDPEVVVAACLAHDLGHPPFGHVGEQELNARAVLAGAKDGFEGNAQTFRIVTTLAMHHQKFGLNLTRASLNAVAKYPWLAGAGPGSKFGCFKSEEVYLRFAREHLALGPHQRSLEAEVMDWADDIAYAVHDVEDFFRAGFIPLDQLQNQFAPVREHVTAWETANPGAEVPVDEYHPDDLGRELQEVVTNARRRWWEPSWGETPSGADFTRALYMPMTLVPFERPYRGTDRDRLSLRQFTGYLAGRYVQVAKLVGSGLDIPKEPRIEVSILKELTRRFVVEDPALATQEHGQRRVIRQLFEAFNRALRDGQPDIFPARVVDDARELLKCDPRELPYKRVRFVVDVIASMTDDQAVRTHRRLMGIDLGSLSEGALL